MAVLIQDLVDGSRYRAFAAQIEREQLGTGGCQLVHALDPPCCNWHGSLIKSAC